MFTPVSSANAPHYHWGDSCEGWRLVDTPELSVILERVPPGASERRHFHRASRQFFFVLSGTACLEIDGTEHQLSPNTGIEVGPACPHRFMNHSEQDVVFTVTSAPTTKGDRVDLE